MNSTENVSATPIQVSTQALDFLPGGLFVFQTHGHHQIQYANQRAMEIMGCHSFQELIDYTNGYFDNLLTATDARNIFYQIDHETKSGAISFVNTKARSKTGKIQYLQNLVRLVKDPVHGDLYYLFLVDPHTPTQIDMMDPLTGLPGQRRFLEYASNWFRMNAQMGSTHGMMILYVNICHFKNFNLKFGLEEGDHLLKDVATVLQDVFPNDFVSRFSDDHFVILTYKMDLKPRMMELKDKVSALRSSVKLEIKVGIYEVESTDMIPSKACDLAKLACDSIESRPETYYCLYTPQISRSAELKDYVIYHIDHALKQGYIKVFFQPVVRSLTTTLCGMEALARWIDPVKGFLSPGEFIPPLEESRQLFKLDLFMIEEVCKRYRTCKDQGLPIVPMSFNLSRMDFFTCDIFNKVQELAEKYNVPHHMLNIEITESMFVKDSDEIKTELNKFRAAGYQVWMDDFGSGYSSLNALKDYHFDELKIDMAFLSSFTQKSKDILLGTVRMAKDINIHTLAEGVETKSQFEFLRSIGCEKIQGYYFGKPMPYEELVPHMEGKGIPFEKKETCEYYEPASQENVLVSEPMALAEYNEETNHCHFLFANAAYEETLHALGSPTLSISEEKLNQKSSIVMKFIRNTLDQAIRSGKSETITYPYHNKFIWLKLKKLSTFGKNHIFRVYLVDMSSNADKMEQIKLDGLSQNIFTLYNTVVVQDALHHVAEPIICWNHTPYSEVGKKYDLEESLAYYETHCINPEGQIRFRTFSNPKTVVQRLKKSPTHMLVDYFRTKMENDQYRWCRHSIIAIPDTDDNVFLYTVKETYADSNLMEKQLIQVYMQKYHK